MSMINISNNPENTKNNNSENSEDDLSFSANGDNKIVFLSKEERSFLKKQESLKEQQEKEEREKQNIRHRQLYLRRKKLYLKTLKSEKNKKIPKKNLTKKEKNKLEELKQIKQHYIGDGQPKIVKKKEIKPKEMIKDFFMFNWNDSEDTTQQNKNYLPKMTPKIMFGKGNLGGMEGMDDFYYDENKKKYEKRIKYHINKKNMKNRSRSRSLEKKDEKEKSKEKEKLKEDNKKTDQKKKDDTKVKNKGIRMPKLNDGKKYNWRINNIIYKY